MLKVTAFVLFFVAGALLSSLLINIRYSKIKKEFVKFSKVIPVKIKSFNSLLKGRSKKFEDQLIDGLEILSNSLKSGFSLFQGLSLLSEEMPPPMSQEFLLVLQEVKLGVPLEGALQNLSRRIKSEELDIVITAIEISNETGGSLSETLDKVSSTIRERNKINEKIKVLTSQGRMEALIVGLMPVFLCIIIFVIDPQFIIPLFSQPLGWIMLSIAIVMEIVGIIVLRRIMKVDI